MRRENNMHKETTLQFNREKGCYEGHLLVQVDAELFRRLLLQEVAQDEAADLTDPTTWTKAIEKIGNVNRWLNNPHTILTSVGKPVLPSSEVVQAPLVQKAMRPKPSGSQVSYADIENTLRTRARTVPPYQWETLRDPVPPGRSDAPEKKRNSYVRSDQKKILA
jgi:hypothetical protein